MKLLDFDLDQSKVDQTTVKDALKNKAFVSEINHLIMEGFIEIEEDNEGNIRVYPCD